MEGEGDLFPSSNYLDDVFTLKDLLSLEKAYLKIFFQLKILSFLFYLKFLILYEYANTQ